MNTSSAHLDILLVEDDEDHALLVQHAFEDAGLGATITHVDNGESAVAVVTGQPPYDNTPAPDLILLDLKIPRLSGHEVLNTIKQNPDFCKIPVVILTTSEAEADRSRAYDSYANSYLVKPLDMDDFNSLIGRVYDYWGRLNSRPRSSGASTEAA